MLKVPDSMRSSLKLAAILAVAAVVTGCISAKSTPTELAEPAEPVTPAASEPVIVAAPDVLTEWTVVPGNHLWGISGTWEVFNVPEKWPLLYKANLDQVVDADLIYPGQVLRIPRDSTLGEVEAAIRHAKTRGAWAVGPVELSDKEYLKRSP